MNSFTYLSFKKTFALFIPNIFKNVQSRSAVFITFILICADILIASVLLPHFSKYIANAFSASLASTLSIALIMFGLLWTLEKTIGHLEDIFFFPAINNNIQNITYQVVKKIHTVPFSTYQTLSTPEIINAVRRISVSARAFVKIFLLLIFPAIIKVLIALQASRQFNAVGFMLIPAFLLCLWGLYKGTHWYVRTRENSWQLSDKVIMRINDSILNTKITRFHLDDEMSRIDSLLKQEAKLWHSTNTRLHLIHVFVGLVLGLTFTLVLWQAFEGAAQKNLTMGDFLLLKTQLIAAFLPFKQLSVEFRQLAEASIDIKKIIQVLDMPEEQNFSKAYALFCGDANHKEKGIYCQNIHFSYPNHKPILKGVSFHFVPGEKVAILGENGSGKSSLIRLLSGLESPEKGEIILHGQNIQHYPKNELRQILHCIPQDLRLFNVSIKENLCYGTQNCSESDILVAAKAVNLLPLLTQLPNGLDSLVGDLGTLLSGGEIQRIALARAILLKPEILLLDETLHSLNVEGEQKMLETLCSLIPTIILISHRPSTLNFVDKAYRLTDRKLFEIPLTTKPSMEFIQDAEQSLAISNLYTQSHKPIRSFMQLKTTETKEESIL